MGFAVPEAVREGSDRRFRSAWDRAGLESAGLFLLARRFERTQHTPRRRTADRLRMSGLNELRGCPEHLRPEPVMARAVAERADRMAALVRNGLSEPPGAAGHDEPWLRSGALRGSVGASPKREAFAAEADGLQAVAGSSDPCQITLAICAWRRCRRSWGCPDTGPAVPPFFNRELFGRLHPSASNLRPGARWAKDRGGLTRRARLAQHATWLTARPPRLVSLYFERMSSPVCRMVSITVSSETTCVPSPRSAR